MSYVMKIPVLLHRWFENGAGWACDESLLSRLPDFVRLMGPKLSSPEQEVHFEIPAEDGILIGVIVPDKDCPDKKAASRHPFILKAAFLRSEKVSLLSQGNKAWLDAVRNALGHFQSPQARQSGASYMVTLELTDLVERQFAQLSDLQKAQRQQIEVLEKEIQELKASSSSTVSTSMTSNDNSRVNVEPRNSGKSPAGVAGIVIATGCLLATLLCGFVIFRTQKKIEQLQANSEGLIAQIQSLEAQGNSLTSQLATLAPVPDAARNLENSFKELRLNWTEFKAAYDEETATIVTKNLGVVKTAVEQLKELRTSADTRLTELDGIRTTAVGLLDQMTRYEKQAKELDKIGALTASLKEVDAKLAQLQASVTRAETDASQARQAADSAERTARSAELKADRAESKARSAESTARSVESKALTRRP